MHRKLIILLLLMTTAGIHLFAQRTEDVLAYISAYKEFAISEMKRTGVPAAITLAQGIHETEAGTSDLVKKSNNHFGIKCKSSWVGDKVYHDDDAMGECFRSYSRPEDSYMDHSDFLKQNQRYSFLFSLDPADYQSWAYGLKKAGYATNIRYSQVLIKIIEDYHLQEYTFIALGTGNQTAPVLASMPLNTATGPSPDLLPTDNNVAGIPPAYPSGTFLINNTRVIYANGHTFWVSIAEKYHVPVLQLWDFNDLEKDDDILLNGQLVYLQRKRKAGAAAYHIIRNNENLYDICQAEGIRLESLLELNYLNNDMQPAAGEKLSLQYAAPSRPLLVGEKTRVSINDPGSSRPMALSLLPALNGNATGSDPTFTMHQVAGKETLYSISRKYGVEVEKIREWNRLDSLSLRTGQSLIIYKSN